MADNPFAKYADPQQSDNPFAKYAPATPNAEPETSLGRTLGLDARSVVHGITAIPQMLMNAEGGIYNAGANLVQGYHAPDEANGPFRFRSAGQNADALMTKAGLPQPKTGEERLLSDVVSGVSGVAGGQGIARGLQSLQKPVSQAVGRVLASNPGKQAIGGVTGGLAAGGAREAGAPVPVQMAAGLVGGAAPFANPAALVRGGALTPAEQRVTATGYVIPPNVMENPSMISKVLGGAAGKIKSQQAASTANQKLTNQLAASSLGVPRDTLLNDNVFARVRSQAGQAYKAVQQAIPTTHTDPAFFTDLNGLGLSGSKVAQEFPHLVKNDGITDLVQGFLGKSNFSTEAAIDAVKILRARATKNLQAIGDPERNDLGHAQKGAANAIDDLLDRNVTNAGSPTLVNDYRAARQLIAKSHDVESATNTATGEVNASRFGLLSDKGKPLTGELAKIADAANSIPKHTQTPSTFGKTEPISKLDMLAALSALGGGLASGHGLGGAALAGGAVLSGPLSRGLVLSKAYQQALRNQAPMGAAGLLPQQAVIDANMFRNNQ